MWTVFYYYYFIYCSGKSEYEIIAEKMVLSI